jgi:integrase/recombinase XerD
MASTTVRKKKKVALEDVDLLVSDLVEEFITEKKADGRSEKTIKSYRGSFSKMLQYFGNDWKIGDITRSTVYQYKGHLVSLEELSTSSINHYLRDFRTFIYWCKERAYIVDDLKVELVKGQEEVIEVYTDEELDKLLTKPHSNESFAMWRDWAIVNWVLGTGNRLNTIINIKIGDVHFGRKEIVIRAQKNKKATVIPLSAKLSAVLKTYIRKCLSEMGDDDYLFCNIYGEKITADALKHSIAKYNNKRGVDRTSIHALRHTFAKQWVVNGGDVFRLQKLLGHSTLEMTRHYVNLFNADLKRDYEDFSPLDTITRGKGGSRKAMIVVEKD